MKTSRGFTLIELMIAVAIIGILTSVAYPAYQGYVETSRRAAARAAVSGIANDLEGYYARNNSYTGWNNLATFSADKYALAVQVPPNGASYTITATTTTGSAGCRTLTMTQTGQGMPAACW